MSYYYKYKFTSAEDVLSVIREEFKSYIDTGAIDDVMWPTYVNKCLQKLGKSSYNIVEQVLYIEDFQARLPDNFIAVREAWLCTSVSGRPYRTANSFYSQAASEETIQVSPLVTTDSCTNVDCTDTSCTGTCMPTLIQAVYKTNNELNISYKRMYLLKPGNISARQHCSFDCINFGSSSPDSFDIRDNKFVTNFREGIIYLVFYSDDYDNEGNQLIPDNYRIKEFIEAFIKYKVMETLTNQVNDETFNQLQQKMVYYKQQSDEAYILAELEIKKQTIYQKQNAMRQHLNRFNMYELPSGGGYWRRNGTN